MDNNIAIIGTGGLGREICSIIEAINQISHKWNIIGFFDENAKEDSINGYPNLGGLDNLKSFNSSLSLVIAIGNPKVKFNVYSKLIRINKFSFPNIIHPSAQIDDKTLNIGFGNIIGINVVITVNVILGNFTCINTSSVIAHDVTIDDFTMIMPTVSISAGATIGKNVYVGNGVKIDQPVNIPDDTNIPLGQLISVKKKDSNQIYLSSSDVKLNQVFSFLYEAIQNNEVTSKGANINGLEEDIATFLNKDSSVACLNSGTSAIHLALIMIGVGLQDEVICQSMTFSASANPIVYQGATPVFIDSESETWNMCPKHLETAIKDRILNGKKPKAIIIVHLYGMPAKIDEIKAIALKYSIALVEDAAEALGSRYKGQKCGTFSDYGILSFNGNKIITTSGGGALVCNTTKEKQKAVFLATQARDHASHYQHSEIGYNYRMSNISAGIGRGQMQVLDKHIELRRQNNEFYKKLFKSIEGVNVFTEPSKDYYSNHWLSCILFNEGAKISSKKLRLALEKENIESRPLWKPMHLQPVFSNCLYYGNKVSENLFLNGLCLPSGSNLTKQEKQRIKKVIELAFN